MDIMHVLQGLYLKMFINLPFSAFSLKTFFETAKSDSQTIGSIGVGVLGVLAILAGGVFFGIAAFKKQGKSQWFIAGIAAIIIGGYISTNAFDRMNNVGDGLGELVTDWGEGKTSK